MAAAASSQASTNPSIAGTVKTADDSDGKRTEIRCQRCDADLSHVFEGEAFTPKNTHHCVNLLSLDFVIDNQVRDTKEGILAGGCFFWGVIIISNNCRGFKNRGRLIQAGR